MPLNLKVASGPELLKTYIYLPSLLYTSYADFVPPFYKDELNFHDPLKNKQLNHSKTLTLLAYREDNPVGRIMGIIHYPWNEKHNVKQARFYQLDCINDESVAGFLLEAVEKWAVREGMNEIIGSFGFSDKDPQGVQLDGFNNPPVIASVSHAPYLNKLIEAWGYTKFKDCISYRLEIPAVLPSGYNSIYQRILKNQQLKLIEFTSRKELKPYFIPVMKLMNEAYQNIFGFVPMEESDMNELAKQYLSVLDPGLVKIILTASNTPVAFVIAMANISKGIRKAKGKLFPLGFLHILMEMRVSTQLDLLLGAVSKNYRGRGLNVLLGISLMDTARKKGLTVMDSHLILEENHLMRAEMEKLGGELHKRYRIYHKELG